MGLPMLDLKIVGGAVLDGTGRPATTTDVGLAGDRIEVLAPGAFNETFMPMGAGTTEAPVEITLAPGRYDFFPANALKLKLHISNDNG